MGLYKYYDPVTGTRKPIKSGSIVNMDGTNEYTPDEVKEIDDKIGILSGTSGTKEKANKEDLDSHLADSMPHLFTDGIKDYRYGFSVVDGIVTFNFEEVVE